MRALAFPVLILLVLPGLAREIRPDPAVAGAPAAAEILKACADKYAHCATYQDQGVVRAWKDLSGNGHDGTLAAGAPLLAANQINSRPAVQFKTASGPCGKAAVGAQVVAIGVIPTA